MDINDTAFNDFVFCSDCEYGQDCFVDINQEFYCPVWGTIVRKVGVCKHYRQKNKIGDTSNGNNQD